MRSDGSVVINNKNELNPFLKQNPNKSQESSPGSYYKLKTKVKKLAKNVKEEELKQMRVS